MNELSPQLLNNFFYFICGKQLGKGAFRTVFENTQNNKTVIKVENVAGSFQNVNEWEVWQRFKYTPSIAKWLAPCLDISDCGTFLIQERAYDLRPYEEPKKLPLFLTDRKLDNFGRIGKRLVSRDYGYIRMTLDERLTHFKNG